MTDREFQSWLEQTEKATNSFYDFIDSTKSYDGTPELDDTFGWGVRFQQMWSLKKDRPCGLLLTGPSGCGKHTAAAHMFHLLYDDFYAMLLSGPELCSEGFATAKARLLGLIGKFDKEENRLCLILEDMEHCDCRRELFSCLGQELTVSWLGNKTEPRLFVILIDSDEESIPSNLRSRLRLCRMSLPTAQRRRIYLTNTSPILQKYLNLDLLVDSTDGVTYAQLVDLTRNLECVINLENQELSDADLLAFLKEQLPAPQREDVFVTLAQSAQQLIGELPQLLKDAIAAVPQHVPAVIQNPTKNPEPEPPVSFEMGEPDRNKIAEQPVITLMTDIYGEKFIQGFNTQNAQSRLSN